MDKIKKTFLYTLVTMLVFTLGAVPFLSVFAQESFDNETYWSNICNTVEGYRDHTKDCDAFREHLKNKQSEADKLIEDLKGDVNKISGNIKKDEQTLLDVNKKIDELSADIANTRKEIAFLESRIRILEEDIEKREVEIAEKHETARKYMVNIQSSTRLNVFVDFLLGGEDFAEISRRIEGMNRINEKNQENIRELNEAKEKLEEKKEDLDFQKVYLEDAVNEQEAAKKEQETLQALAQERISVLRREYQAMVDARNAAEQAKKALVSRIDKIGPIAESAGGLARPISTGFYVSASVWNYPEGSKHLGIDLAASVGTSIVAPANGIVVATNGSCPTYGSLSSSCGGGYGNYILMIVRDESSAYGALYGHMQSGGVLVSVGQQISKGQQIGKVGSSGSSTGPHVHAELFYLGNKSVQQAYDDWYNGSRNIQFGLGGAGWSDEYSNRCDVKGMSADCRMNPSAYWGLYVGNRR